MTIKLYVLYLPQINKKDLVKKVYVLYLPQVNKKDLVKKGADGKIGVPSLMIKSNGRTI